MTPAGWDGANRILSRIVEEHLAGSAARIEMMLRLLTPEHVPWHAPVLPPSEQVAIAVGNCLRIANNAFDARTAELRTVREPMLMPPLPEAVVYALVGAPPYMVIHSHLGRSQVITIEETP